MIDLSILVLSLASRAALLGRLLERLSPQLSERTELLIACDCGSRAVWEKRNTLLAAAQGRYICYCDDDDLPSERYCSALLGAIEAAPDCVGFKVKRFEDGKPYGRAVHSLRFETYSNIRNGDRWIFERTPNHLNPVRIELAREIGFREFKEFEDIDYAKRLRPLLKSEVFIDEYLYEYWYETPQYRERKRQ